MAKIKNCFMDEIDGFNYEFEVKMADKQVIKIKAHTMTYADSRKMGVAMSKEWDGKPPSFEIGFDPVRLCSIVIDEWNIDREPSYEAIALMPKDIRANILDEILKHEGEINGKTEAIEKN